MLKIISLLVLAISFVSCNSTSDYQHSDYIIQNAKMFDGDDVHTNTTIIIHDGIVQKIYTDQNTSFSGKNVIDGKGSTVIPGLINAHAHLDSIEKGEAAVKAGVLTLMDMARLTISSNPSIDKLHKLGDSVSYLPYFYSAGNPVVVPKGHGMQFQSYETISTVEELPEFIEKRAHEGSDYVKIMIDRGGAP